jgi:hypothetical protein
MRGCGSSVYFTVRSYYYIVEDRLVSPPGSGIILSCWGNACA